MFDLYLTCIDISKTKTFPNSEIVDVIIENSVRLLQKFQKYQENNQIPKVICYRLKPLVYLLTSLIKIKTLQRCNDDNIRKAIMLVLQFISNYDESILEYIITNYLPGCEFYHGYLTSQKHLELSDYYFTNSPKLSTHFLCLNESEFLPLPVNFLYIPLQTELSLSPYLSCILTYLCSHNPHSYTSVLESVNKFMMRKDINFTDHKSNLRTILNH